MAKGKDPKVNDLRVHETIDKLTPGARRFTGYVGRGRDSEASRLYPSLDDLDHYIDFEASDVLHHEQDPDGGAVTMWLKPEAVVVVAQRAKVNQLARKRLSLNVETIRRMSDNLDLRVRNSDRCSRTCSHQTEDCISGCRGCDSVDIPCSGGCPGTDDMGCTWSIPC